MYRSKSSTLAGVAALMLLSASITSAQSPASAPGGKSSPPATSGRFIKAVVVDDRLSALRRGADIQSQVVQRLRLGRPVLIIQSRSAKTGQPSFYRVAVTRRTRGWVHQAALAVPGRSGEDQRLLRLIESAGDGLDRIALCLIFSDRFSHSPLLAQALLAMGQEADRAARLLGQRARRRLANLNEGSLGAPIRDYYLTDPGLDRYSKLNINFYFKKSTAEYFYDGKAYRDIIKRFPKSGEAAEARKRLAAAEQNSTTH